MRAHFVGWNDDTILWLAAMSCIGISEYTLVHDRLIKTIKELDFMGPISVTTVVTPNDLDEAMTSWWQVLDYHFVGFVQFSHEGDVLKYQGCRSLS